MFLAHVLRILDLDYTVPCSRGVAGSYRDVAAVHAARPTADHVAGPVAVRTSPPRE